MSEITEIKRSLDRILFYLENDPKTGKEGLVTEIENVKSDVAGLKNTMINFIAEYRQAQAVKNAKVGLIATLASAIVTVIMWLIKIFW